MSNLQQNSLFGQQNTSSGFGGVGSLFGKSMQQPTSNINPTSSTNPSNASTSFFAPAAQVNSSPFGSATTTFGSATSPFATAPTSQNLFQNSTTPGNTQSTNLFGSSIQPLSQSVGTSSLFGSGGNSVTAAQQPTNSSIFGTTPVPATASQQPLMSNTLGSLTTPATISPIPATTGLFGSAVSPPASLQSSTAPSIFGSNFNSSSNSQQAPTGNMFETAPNLDKSSQPAPTPSLFGSSNNQTSTGPQIKSIFGSSTLSQPPSNNIATSSTQSQQTASSIFGSRPTSVSQQSGSLFGNLNAKSAGTTSTQSAQPTSPTHTKPATQDTSIAGTAASLIPAPSAPLTFNTNLQPTGSQQSASNTSLLGLFGAANSASSKQATSDSSKVALTPKNVIEDKPASTSNRGSMIDSTPPSAQTSPIKEVPAPLGSITDGSNSSTAQLPGFGKNASETEKLAEKSETKPDAIHQLSASYYERVDDLLRVWEQRTRHQFSGFSKYADVMISVDLDLCNFANRLDKLNQMQSMIQRKQQDIDSCLDHIEKHQSILSDSLQGIQSALSKKEADQVQPSRLTDQLHHRLQAFATSLTSSKSTVELLVDSVNNLHENIYDDPLKSVLSTLNLQQQSIVNLYEDMKNLRCQLEKLQL